jgi:superfamily II DNA helicase RecQ
VLLQEILRNKVGNIIAVLPTGSGKSLAIFGPLLAGTTGVSVVITCYAALRRQLAEQARGFGIKYLLWNERNLDGRPSCTDVQLVIMITDDMYRPDART